MTTYDSVGIIQRTTSYYRYAASILKLQLGAFPPFILNMLKVAFYNLMNEQGQ